MRQISLFDMVANNDMAKIADPFKLLETIACSDCTRCRRSEYRKATQGQKIAVYRGNPRADFWVMGKSPGMNDGIFGVPYSHGSGEMLMKWIEFIGKNPETDAFMTNPVFCAAEDDRTPTAGEMKECSLYVNLLVEKFKPKSMLALGMTGYRASAKQVDNQVSMSALGGMQSPIESRYGIPLWVVYHPAYFFKGTPDLEEAKQKTEKTLRAMKAWYANGAR